MTVLELTKNCVLQTLNSKKPSGYANENRYLEKTRTDAQRLGIHRKISTAAAMILASDVVKGIV